VIELSKRKADRIINWNAITETTKEGDIVKGKVMRKIKGGLLVDIGVPVFLPASQVDIRRPGDIGEYIGREIEAKILKIDMERRNIVISPPQAHRREARRGQEKLMAEIEDRPDAQGRGQEHRRLRRVRRPGRHRRSAAHHRHERGTASITRRQMLKIDEEIEVKILNVDREKEKIALGLKQKEAQNPWENIAERYPVG
jgi:small subunit ribosomal protein S1